MNQSLFIQFVSRFFPVLATIIERYNGKRTPPTYLFKQMLRVEYSPDGQWESANVNTKYVSADMVSLDSPLPIKARGSLGRATGKIPKIGMKKKLKESQLTQLLDMAGNANKYARVITRLTDDAVACSYGIDEEIEYQFLFSLSNGYTLIKDLDDESDNAIRLDFEYLDDNKFETETKDKLTIADIRKVYETARDRDNVAITYIMLDLAKYNLLRNSDDAKQLVADYRGITYTASTKLPTPGRALFNEAIADEFDGLQVIVVNRSVLRERNGVATPEKPWNTDSVMFLPTEEAGALAWADLAESSRPVDGVSYQKLDNYKLISKYSKTDPLQEFTAGSARITPVIENVDMLYQLKVKRT